MEWLLFCAMRIWNNERALREARNQMDNSEAGKVWKALYTKRLRVLYAIRRDRNVNPY